MQRVGLTGGIGSGKTTVAKLFETLGVPVFYADSEAHRIRNRAEVSEQIVRHFGSAILSGEQIDKRKLAEVVFNDSSALQWLNNLLHPLVVEAFAEWCEVQSETHPPFVMMEAALIFEANLEHLFDKIIVVDAPEDLCVSRVMTRENISREEVLQRMSQQINPAEKIEKANLFIHNDERDSLIEQVMSIQEFLLSLQNN